MHGTVTLSKGRGWPLQTQGFAGRVGAGARRVIVTAGASRGLDFNGECRQVYPDSQGDRAKHQVNPWTTKSAESAAHVELKVGLGA